jgi:murein DD-endopeptidase MepM/ murein hydrolase activator NlpD
MKIPARTVALLGAAALLAATPALAQEPFTYNPPGLLTDGSGEGRFDEEVYAPGMRFPIEAVPAFLNSQVWGYGGSQGPSGGQCHDGNFSYPWWDNYCEKRTWEMPLCPAGQGHQGQDIRGADCEKDKHWVVAGVDGTITTIGSYSVYLTAADGTRFDYLHMSNVQVAVNDEVKRGDKLGMVSNQFGGTPTTVHLHFNIKQNVEGVGFVFVPPYMSLVASYQELINTPAKGELESASCERARGASFDPDTPDAPGRVLVSVGGTWDAADAVQFEAPADRSTDMLCDDGEATCARGFDTLLPIALLDGKSRDVHVYALDTWVGGAPVEIGQSPAAVPCGVFSTEKKVRRRIQADQIAEEWGFSLFFDQLLVPPEVTDALPEGKPLPRRPQLVASEDGSEHWIHDLAVLRPISEAAMFAFRLDPAAAQVWPASKVELVTKGPAWPERPAIARGAGATFYLLEDAAGLEVQGGLLGGEEEEVAPSTEPEGDVAACACRAPVGQAGAAGGALGGAAIGLVSAWFSRRRRNRVPGSPRVR